MRKFKRVGGRVKFRLPKLQTEYHKKLTTKFTENYYKYEYDKRPYKDNERFFVHTFEKHITGLPVNIWLYDAGEIGYFTKIPHIWFQKDKSDNDKFWYSYMMSISEKPQVLTKKLKPAKKFYTELKMSEINKIIDWVFEYYELLIKHWKQEIDSSDFINFLKNESISYS